MENIANEISSLAVSPQANLDTGYKDIFWYLEQQIGEDVGRVKDFVQKGIITQGQGQYLYGLLVKKAQELNNYKLAAQQNVQNLQTPAAESIVPPQENPFEQFGKEHPGFFDGDGRGAVLDYLKGYNPDKDEILKIAQLVEKLENSAVDKFMKKSEYEKSLNDENAAAKSKLTAYAQKSTSDGGIGKVFTREEIGKMSGKEFDRNEDAIMAQLRSGLIR